MAKSKSLHPNQSGRFVMRYECLMESPAYRSLSTVARCLLEEFQRVYYPDRNGRLSISTRNAAKLLNVSEPTATAAFYDLEEHGFIALANHENWMERRAREWRLTFERNGTRAPTDEWATWSGEPFPSHRKNRRPKKQGQSAQV